MHRLSLFLNSVKVEAHFSHQVKYVETQFVLILSKPQRNLVEKRIFPVRHRDQFIKLGWVGWSGGGGDPILSSLVK